MDALKQYIRDNIMFDTHDDETGDEFNTALYEELDRLSIYHYECKVFFDLDPETVIHLAVMEAFTIDATTSIDDISREAMYNLASNYMYAELKALYMGSYEGNNE